MKKTLTTLVAAVGIAANASAATLVGEWSDFSSLSSTGGTGSLALVTSGSTSVQEGVLNVVGASGGTATVDLTNAGLTQAKGITIFMSVSNVGSFNGGGPFGLVSLAATGQDFAALCGYADGSNTVSFARNGSVKNVTTNLPTTGSDISSLKGDRPMTFTLTLDSTRFAAYLNGSWWRAQRGISIRMPTPRWLLEVGLELPGTAVFRSRSTAWRSMTAR